MITFDRTFRPWEQTAAADWSRLDEFNEAQLAYQEELQQKIDEENAAKLEELRKMIEELQAQQNAYTPSTAIDPIPLLSPEASLTEVIDVINKAIAYINTRIADGT